MSSDNDLAAAEALPTSLVKCCASCGIAAIDGIKLKPCPKCDIAQYCNDECQQDHLEIHEASCKQRAAALYDELLFKQPESSNRGDCPICFLPMPIDGNNQNRIKVCCGQIICRGCSHAASILIRAKENRCPFCRHLQPETLEECEKLAMERAKLNDPIAMQGLAKFNFQRGDYDSAFKYWSRAAALGEVESMYRLALMYADGKGVEEDKNKERALLEKAAIAGHTAARFHLGCDEFEYGRYDRAVKHWIISANLGYSSSIKLLKDFYKAGYVSKEDFAASLRAYQAAADAMKSPQREAAKVWDACDKNQNTSK